MLCNITAKPRHKSCAFVTHELTTFAGLDTKKGIQRRSSKVSLCIQLNSLLERNGKALVICHTSSGMTFIQAAFDEEMFLLIFSRRILPCQQQHHAQCQGSALDSPSFLDAESSGAGLRHKFWAHCSLSSSLEKWLRLSHMHPHSVLPKVWQISQHLWKGVRGPGKVFPRRD